MICFTSILKQSSTNMLCPNLLLQCGPVSYPFSRKNQATKYQHIYIANSIMVWFQPKTILGPSCPISRSPGGSEIKSPSPQPSLPLLLPLLGWRPGLAVACMSQALDHLAASLDITTDISWWLHSEGHTEEARTKKKNGWNNVMLLLIGQLPSH